MTGSRKPNKRRGGNRMGMYRAQKYKDAQESLREQRREIERQRNELDVWRSEFEDRQQRASHPSGAPASGSDGTALGIRKKAPEDIREEDWCLVNKGGEYEDTTTAPNDPKSGISASESRDEERTGETTPPAASVLPGTRWWPGWGSSSRS